MALRLNLMMLNMLDLLSLLITKVLRLLLKMLLRIHNGGWEIGGDDGHRVRIGSVIDDLIHRRSLRFGFRRLRGCC